MKLITDGSGNYSLLDDNNDVFATTMESGLTNLKLDKNQMEEIYSSMDYISKKHFSVDYITPDNVVMVTLTPKDKSSLSQQLDNSMSDNPSDYLGINNWDDLFLIQSRKDGANYEMLKSWIKKYIDYPIVLKSGE